MSTVRQECYLLKWKTFNKLARKGKELDPKYFNEHERAKSTSADAKEWQSFIDTGAAQVILPHEAKKVPTGRIFAVPLRYVRTNKDKSGTDGNLEAKSRIVVPGHVDPDGEIPVEEGGFKTDAPTAPQLAFHILLSTAVRSQWKLKTFDCKSAFLPGKQTDRELYARPPKEGLHGVPWGSLIKLVKGAYGLREAPRLSYLRIKELIEQAGFEELRTANACFVLRDYSKSGNPLIGCSYYMLMMRAMEEQGQSFNTPWSS